MKRFGVRALLLFLMCLLPQSVHAQRIRPASLDTLALMRLDSLTGQAATAYFRPGHRIRALELHRLLTRFLDFYRAQGIAAQLRVAVVDSADWRRLTSYPYGLPNNSGPGGDNLLLAAVASPARVGARALPRGELADFLTIGHEGGHLLIWQMMPEKLRAALQGPGAPSGEALQQLRTIGSVPPWYWELAANYLTTAFLSAYDTAAAEAWVAHLRENTTTRPRFTHLGDWFGAVMQAMAPDSTPYVLSAEGGLNQGWYQGVSGLVAAHIQERSEMALLPHIRRMVSGASAPTTEELVTQLEEMAAGVIALLDSLGAAWRDLPSPR